MRCSICLRAATFFQQHEAAQFHGLVEKGLALYKQLAVNAFRRRVLHFPLRPKLHEWQELGEQVLRDRTNPRHSHCFFDEDFLRVVLRAARACPRAAMAGAVLRRWVLKCSLVWSGRCSRWTIVRARKFLGAQAREGSFAKCKSHAFPDRARSEHACAQNAFAAH